MGDCAAHEITVGAFPFVAIDFGGAIRVSDHIQKEAPNVENRESNQCVLLHLVAGRCGYVPRDSAEFPRCKKCC